MNDRATIQDQIDQTRRRSINIFTDLDTLELGIAQEPMSFSLDSINRLKILAASLESLAISCGHTLDKQRIQAQFEARRAKR
jgi:hypothetical protein